MRVSKETAKEIGLEINILREAYREARRIKKTLTDLPEKLKEKFDNPEDIYELPELVHQLYHYDVNEKREAAERIRKLITNIIENENIYANILEKIKVKNMYILLDRLEGITTLLYYSFSHSTKHEDKEVGDMLAILLSGIEKNKAESKNIEKEKGAQYRSRVLALLANKKDKDVGPQKNIRKVYNLIEEIYEDKKVEKIKEAFYLMLSSQKDDREGGIIYILDNEKYIKNVEKYKELLGYLHAYTENRKTRIYIVKEIIKK